MSDRNKAWVRLVLGDLAILAVATSVLWLVWGSFQWSGFASIVGYLLFRARREQAWEVDAIRKAWQDERYLMGRLR